MTKECTSLVIYGTNLGSNVNTGRFSVMVKNLICLHPDYYSMIVGKYYGWLDKSSMKANARFRFKQSIKRSDFVINSFMALSHYCSSYPSIVKSTRKEKIH